MNKGTDSDINEEQTTPNRNTFFITNLLKGLAYFAVIMVLYVVFKKQLGGLEERLGFIYENTFLIYSVFFVSEVVFGIIPPEFFMIWALKEESMIFYTKNVFFFATISYLAGATGYIIGSKFGNTLIYRYIRMKMLRKFETRFRDYGGYLILIAALTPIPFSGICMLAGTAKYNFRRMLLFSAARFGRFLVYSFIIWETNIL